MSFIVTVVDAAHRPDPYAEIEYNGERVAEAFVEDERMRVSFVDLEGSHMWGLRRGISSRHSHRLS